MLGKINHLGRQTGAGRDRFMERKSSQEKNKTIDFFKAIACIGVVLIHCRFPGAVGVIVRTVARFAVPFFTMISGFYLIQTKDGMPDTGRLKRKVKHMMQLIVGAELFAFIFSGLSAVITGQALYSILLNYMGVARWMKLIWDNTPLSYIHFWYLYSMLYCYIVTLVLKKLKVRFGGGNNSCIVSIPVCSILYYECS